LAAFACSFSARAMPRLATIAPLVRALHLVRWSALTVPWDFIPTPARSLLALCARQDPSGRFNACVVVSLNCTGCLQVDLLTFDSNAAQSTQCTSCVPGQGEVYVPSVTNFCVPCDFGQYAGPANLFTCGSCPSGKYLRYEPLLTLTVLVVRFRITIINVYCDSTATRTAHRVPTAQLAIHQTTIRTQHPASHVRQDAFRRQVVTAPTVQPEREARTL